ncbi:hypothetical protein A8L34_22410 [Bacillus sp. FJAT-27264]|uniref:hypothetical protein n=1 Tax=Paenibacillus sp. (strain DSM 101736 / FJAT-27264) TaxID=1850362 RepID=UPI000807D1B2|nr:hypothetical protein [Bacillus sp. FJAT-27264]OBZ08909.1 hypothetical protein A8L34_22410 [Bacillus sp. FJAT-27264]
MTAIAVKAWVFNPELKNMIVSVFGKDEQGDRVNIKGLVVDAQGEELTIKNIYDSSQSVFPLYLFAEDDGLNLEAWDAGPTSYEVPVEYRQGWDGEEK